MQAKYACPMHPEVVALNHGDCVICGTDLTVIMPKANLIQPIDPELASMSQRFYISVILSVILILVHLIGPYPTFEAILATPVVFWCGWPFFVRAAKSLVSFQLNMFTLIGLGIGIAYFFSFSALVFPNLFHMGHFNNTPRHFYFEIAAVITTITLFTQILELKARAKTLDVFHHLQNLNPKTAHLLLEDQQEKEIPIEMIHVGYRLLIKPGEKIPTDGEVLSGESTIDESMITGESHPVAKTKGNFVIGGTVNQAGSLIIRADKLVQETLLAAITKLTVNAIHSKAPVQRVVNQVTSAFVSIVIIIALLSFTLWSWFGPSPTLPFALMAAISVLIIASPNALGLATPLSMTVAMGRGAQLGILFKNAEIIETFSKINALVLDKTELLTEAHPKIQSVEPLNSLGEDSVLQLTTSSTQGVETFKNAGVSLAILTGNTYKTAEMVGSKLGIKEIRSAISPEEKKQFIQELQAMDKRVAMVGDGSQDALAIAQAEVGISIITNTESPTSVASIVLLKSDFATIAKAYTLCSATEKNIRQNLLFAFIYNAMAIPIAAGIFYPLFGFLVSPIIASLAMCLSSWFVISNALRLRNLPL